MTPSPDTPTPTFGVQKPSPVLFPAGVTTESIEGYKITQYYGIVRGIIIFSPVSKSIFERAKAAFGGKEDAFTKVCEQARSDAYQQMITRTMKLGGNAVLSVRYDGFQIAQGMHEISCYGTAVLIEKIA